MSMEVENGNHQKLVSSSVCLRDDPVHPVHPVDLALAAQKSNPPGAVWREFLGTKLPGLELLGLLRFFGFDVFQPLYLSRECELVVDFADGC